MIKLGFLAAAALMFLAGPAAARCNQPYPPIVKITPATTKQEMVTLHDDVASFMKASDLYQECLSAQGAASPVIDANQAVKERLGRDFNAAARTFKASHPG